MAGVKLQFVIETVLVGLLIMATMDFTVAQTGVCYGNLGNALPPPSEVVALYNENNTQRMRIYALPPPSEVELMLGVQNTDLGNLASGQEKANSWFQNNAINYPNVRFRYIAVGNEVTGHGNQIKVSPSIDTGVLGNSYPPSDGEFRLDVRSFIDPIIDFLTKNGAPLLVNIFPYFAYIYNKQQISLEYSLFTSSGIVMPDGTRYQNLYCAILDAILKIIVSESC
ncbi:Glycosyl hydrolase superfamily protein [Abeliophyllum distichum]|uniref:Glycosyl hydrolase superfamily protein n=1 Tax=Abeliophyllum distichum TaxID=126358 RepID=A0ABD1PPY3_9LAMI